MVPSVAQSVYEGEFFSRTVLPGRLSTDIVALRAGRDGRIEWHTEPVDACDHEPIRQASVPAGHPSTVQPVARREGSSFVERLAWSDD